MKIVTLASTKGGGGKSTLAVCLAVAAIADFKKVWLVDLDPQGSLVGWWRMRGRPENPELVLNNPLTIRMAEREMRKQRGNCDDDEIMIVDTPNSPLERINLTVSESQCVIIPMQPGPFDVLSADAINQIVVDQGKQAVTIRVVNRADARHPLLKAAIDEIAANGGGKPIIIGENFLFQTAILDGKAPQEMTGRGSKNVKADVAVLWSAVKGVLDGK